MQSFRAQVAILVVWEDQGKHLIQHSVVEANGIEFRVAEAGDPGAPAVLLLHGFPEGSMSWGPVMERLPGLHLLAPDLRGYPGTSRPAREPRGSNGYDVFALTDDIRALIEALGLVRPLLVAHDWGGALGWIFAHRFSPLIRKLVIVNCTHPRTLVRAAVHNQDWQPFRIPWVPIFEIPWVPEAMLSTRLGRATLRLSFTIREGRKGAMNRVLVDELVGRFQHARDLAPPIDWYRAMVATHLLRKRRAPLYALYDQPISVPVTMVWGMKDGALPAKIAMRSGADAGCEVEWRPLPGVGHFVSLEAPDELAAEIDRALASAPA